MARSEMGFGQRTLVFCRPLPLPIGPVANSSAMRVCHPGPLARHRSITSGGSRRLISCRGLADGGRPRSRTTARASMGSLSSGSSSYSCGLITCASTRLRSEPKIRREAGLFTIVGLSHAEYVTVFATRGVADHDNSAVQQAVADDAEFAVILSIINQLDRCAREDEGGILKVQSSLSKGSGALGGVVGDRHYYRICKKYFAAIADKRIFRSTDGSPSQSAILPSRPQRCHRQLIQSA